MNSGGHQIDYLRFTYSPEYALQRGNLGFMEKLMHGVHMAMTINPDITSEEPKEKGMHGFTHSARLVIEGTTVGYVAAGGNHGRVLVDISGNGCFEIDWLKAYKQLDSLEARLTRVDVCIDDYDGQYDIHHVRQCYKDGVFKKRGQQPSVNMVGPWDNPEKWSDGLSYYIGKIENGLCYVAYEKGKQLGDIESKWVRHEVRFSRTTKKEISMEILLHPYDFVREAYGFFEWVESFVPVDGTHLHIEKAQIQLKELVHWAKQSYGKLVSVLSKVGHTNDQIVNLLKTTGMPERLFLRKQDYGAVLLT